MTVYYYRFFRFFRDFSLVYRLFAGARVYSFRSVSYVALRIVLFFLSRRISAVGDCAAMIAGSASSSMYVQGAYSSLIISYFLRFEYVSVRCSLIIYFVVFYGSLVGLFT